MTSWKINSINWIPKWSGWGHVIEKKITIEFNRLWFNWKNRIESTSIQKPVESKTRTYHGRVESERTTERPEEVGQDWASTELFAQEKKSTVHSKASKKSRFNVSPEARAS